MKLIEYGSCSQCGKPKDREGYYCSVCLEKQNLRRREDREFFKKLGLCTLCRKNKSVHGTYCESCLARAYVYCKKRYENDPEYVRQHNRASSKKRYKECKAMGICTRCRKRKAAEGRVQCLICLEKDALRHKYWYKKKGVENAETSTAM